MCFSMLSADLSARKHYISDRCNVKLFCTNMSDFIFGCDTAKAMQLESSIDIGSDLLIFIAF